jgi:putative Holliday junction resolvase
MTRLLALDVGEARIGVAVSDASGFLASPYTTLQASRNEEQTWQTIQELIRETDAEGLVIGLPISLDGQIHAQGKKVQAFAQRLQPHISVPLIFWDERLSTVEAQRLLSQRGELEGGKRQRRTGQRRSQSKRRQRGQQIDALAAAVFLQDYLNSHNESHTDSHADSYTLGEQDGG